MSVGVWSKIAEVRRRARTKEEIRILRKHLKQRPGDVRAWLRIADLELLGGHREMWGGALVAAARVYIERGSKLKAHAVLREVLRVQPERVDAVALQSHLLAAERPPVEDVGDADIVEVAEAHAPRDAADLDLLGQQAEEAHQLLARAMRTLAGGLGQRELDLELFDRKLRKLHETVSDAQREQLERLETRRARLEAEAELLRESATDVDAAVAAVGAVVAAVATLRASPGGAREMEEELADLRAELADKDAALAELQGLVDLYAASESPATDEEESSDLPPSVRTWLRGSS